MLSAASAETDSRYRDTTFVYKNARRQRAEDENFSAGRPCLRPPGPQTSRWGRQEGAISQAPIGWTGSRTCRTIVEETGPEWNPRPLASRRGLGSGRAARSLRVHDGQGTAPSPPSRWKDGRHVHTPAARHWGPQWDRIGARRLGWCTTDVKRAPPSQPGVPVETDGRFSRRRFLRPGRERASSRAPPSQSVPPPAAHPQSEISTACSRDTPNDCPSPPIASRSRSRSFGSGSTPSFFRSTIKTEMSEARTPGTREA